MKKNSGFIMTTLISTLFINIIVLSTIAFGTSVSTIEDNNFSDFANNVTEVQSLLLQNAVILRGNEGKNGVSRTDAQVYNYVAKGATVTDENDVNWLTRKDASYMACTQLAPDKMQAAIEYDLPKMVFSTPKLNSVECSYFVTNEGDVFVWPPYSYNNEFYVNGDTKIDADEEEIYKEGFSFKVGNVTIITASEKDMPKSSEDVVKNIDSKTPTVFYTDGSGKSPLGREAEFLYEAVIE